MQTSLALLLSELRSDFLRQVTLRGKAISEFSLRNSDKARVNFGCNAIDQVNSFIIGQRWSTQEIMEVDYRDNFTLFDEFMLVGEKVAESQLEILRCLTLLNK